MDLSKIALFLAFIYFAFGLPILFCPECSKKALKKMIARVTNLRIMALFGILLAYLMLKEYSYIEKSWETVIPVLAYICLFKCLVTLWWPEFMRRTAKRFLLSNMWLTIGGIAALVFGLFLGYLGIYIY